VELWGTQLGLLSKEDMTQCVNEVKDLEEFCAI
jgi:hypothetical protein